MKKVADGYKDELWIKLADIVFSRNLELLAHGYYGEVISKANEHYEAFLKVENNEFQTYKEENKLKIDVPSDPEDDFIFFD